MPKIVNHEERRRELAQAVVEVAAEVGLENASLRRVAQHAGVSMGTVQHYFADQPAMLDFVLSQVQQQRSDRISGAVRTLSAPAPRAILGALADSVLADDPTNRMFERVNAMFIARAQHEPALAARLTEGRATVIGLLEGLLIGSGLRAGVDARAAAEALWAQLESLPIAIGLGAHTTASARDVVDHYLAAVTQEESP